MTAFSDVREDYFHWLCESVALYGQRETYYILLGILSREEFYWSIPLDGDRAEDGKELREHYIMENDMLDYDCVSDLKGPCSVLEMLVALSKRMANDCFDNDNYVNHTADFFWEMVANLDLMQFDDNSFDSTVDLAEIDQRLRVFLDREYFYDGTGGLFPLKNPLSDQRENLIWYQKEAYLAENYAE